MLTGNLASPRFYLWNANELWLTGVPSALTSLLELGMSTRLTKRLLWSTVRISICPMFEPIGPYRPGWPHCPSSRRWWTLRRLAWWFLWTAWIKRRPGGLEIFLPPRAWTSCGGHRSTWLATSATALLVWLNIQVNAPCLWFLGMFSGYWDPTPKYLSWNQTSFVLRFVKDSSWFLLMFPMTRVVRSLWLRPFWIGPMISFDLASAPCPQTWSWRLGSGPTLDLWGGGGQKKSCFFILSCSSWSLSIPGLWRSG